MPLPFAVPGLPVRLARDATGIAQALVEPLLHRAGNFHRPARNLQARGPV